MKKHRIFCLSVSCLTEILGRRSVVCQRMCVCVCVSACVCVGGGSVASERLINADA
jgi:hypothetical protein